ncbi:L,D-transpeptidase [Paracoccus suum]|uniref:L,D-transpeptidase n=1 Tax=Paracoccus suum TaxID=2259340 RepID=A0A344PGJ8_9RHOB|nr:L,D-transpeptidase [Paracoccus suum]AXC48503.1 L,D-transpeptidase [Paracoccus suum]
MRIASLALMFALGLAACTDTPAPTASTGSTLTSVPPTYQARTDVGPNGEPVPIPAVNIAYLTERNRRQQVPYNGPEAPGTIVVDPYSRFLYHVMEGGQAMRYGVAVGKAGTGFSGSATIQRKAAWPSWTPTANMVRTNPELYGPVKNGLKGGLDNPLGSRALYLYNGGKDTYYRIHGTMDPSSIGKATSAGCIRLFNQDILDLFQQVPIGTAVRVRSPEESRRYEGELVESPEGYLTPVGGTVVHSAPTGAVAGDVAAATTPSIVESAVPAG